MDNYLTIGNKNQLNKLIKKAIVVFPEAVLTTTVLSVKLDFFGEFVLSAIKCRGGWSILLPKKFWYQADQEKQIELLERCLKQ